MDWKKLFGFGKSRDQVDINEMAIQLGLSEEHLTIIKGIANTKLEPFYQYDMESNSADKTIGISFKTNEANAENQVSKLNAKLKPIGYQGFICDHDHKKVGIIKGTDQFNILRVQQTNGDNYDISNEDVISKLMEWNKRYPYTIIGADYDWMEANFEVLPTNKEFSAFATELYKFCPDIVDQGSGSIKDLIEEMKETRKLYLWWD